MLPAIRVYWRPFAVLETTGPFDTTSSADHHTAMELREYAQRILLSTNLDEKLQVVPGPFTDDNPGEPIEIDEPGRPDNLHFAPRRTAPAMPKPAAFTDPKKMAVAHHIMANHELQALEVMAWVLCRFPEAPSEFRQQMVDVMTDEQRHAKLHIDCGTELGIAFGELPVNCYIWKKAMSFECVLDYLAGIPLTFEGRNLDHALEFKGYFEDVNEERSAAAMQVIHDDEVRHVEFGVNWLRRLKPPGMSDWDVFCQHLKWPLRPSKAKGPGFQRDSRRQAGMSEDFIARLEAVDIETE